MSEKNETAKTEAKTDTTSTRRLPSRKHHYEEDTSDDDGLFDSNKTISACSKIFSAAEDGFASSNESESGLADLPLPDGPYLPYISLNEATNDLRSPSSQDTDEQLSSFSVDSDCSDHTEINAVVVNEEAEDQAHIYLESNSSSSNGEELDSCDDSIGNDSSSDESDNGTRSFRTMEVIAQTYLRRAFTKDLICL